MEEGDVGGMRGRERDRDERKVLKKVGKKFAKEGGNTEREKENTSKKVNQSSIELIERGESELCRGRKKGGNQGEKKEVHRGTRQ